MEKLELKHLAPYLPYGVIIKYNNGETSTLTQELMRDTAGFLNSLINVFKPILRPLSDLTKEIEHNGERFVPSEIMCGGTLPISAKLQQIEDYQKRPLLMPFGCVEYLLKWHFDVFGLIDKGLAVDINTLKT